MKKGKLLAVASVAAMLLAACGTAGSKDSSTVSSSLLPDSSSEVQRDSSVSSSVSSSESKAPSSASSGNGSSTNSSRSGGGIPIGGSSKSSSSFEVPTAWGEDEAAILKEHFYDVKVPYYYVKNCSVLQYDEEDNVAYRFGGTSSPELLAKYALLFDDSWEDNSTAGDPEASSYYYYFTKKTKLANGKIRCVDVIFCGANQQTGKFTSDGTGLFYMEISDPYMYEWPTEYVDKTVKEYISQTETVPAYTGLDYLDYYEGYLKTDSTLVLYAYTSDVNAETTYGNVLKAAKYEYKGAASNGFKVYYSEKGSIEVDIAYVERYGALFIYIGEGPGEVSETGWSAKSQEVLDTYFNGVDVPYDPALGLGTLTYSPNQGGFAYAFGGTSSATLLAGYAEKFDASWEVNTTAGTGLESFFGHYYFAETTVSTPEGDLPFVVEWFGMDEETGDISSDGSGRVAIQMYFDEPEGPDPEDGYSSDTETWDTELINRFTSEVLGATDTVPAYEGGYSYQNSDMFYESDGAFTVYAFTEDANCEAAYTAVVEAAGYTYVNTDQYGYIQYVSPNEEIFLEFAYSEGWGDLDIYFYAYTGQGAGGNQGSWPAQAQGVINEYFCGADIPYSSDIGVTTLTWTPADGGFAYGYGVECDVTLLNSYFALYDASWDPFTTYGTSYVSTYGIQYIAEKEFSDATGTYNVSVFFCALDSLDDISSDGSGTFYIEISAELVAGPTDPGTGSNPEGYEEQVSGTTCVSNLWPAARVEGLLGTWGVTESIPAYNDATSYQLGWANLNYEQQPQFMIACFTTDSGSLTAYVNQLVAAGWDYYGVQSGTTYIDSPEGTLELALQYNTSAQALVIYVLYIEPEPEPGAWPTADVNTYLSAWGYTDALPAYNGTTTFQFSDDYASSGYVAVLALNTPTTCCSDYGQTLLAAGFTYAGYNGTYYVYNSPNNQFQVYLAMQTTSSGMVYMQIFIMK